MTGARAIVMMVALAVPACTRINPLFDSVAAAESSGSTTTGPDGESRTNESGGDPSSSSSGEDDHGETTSNDPTRESSSSESTRTTSLGEESEGESSSSETGGGAQAAVWLYVSDEVPGTFGAEGGPGNTEDHANARCEERMPNVCSNGPLAFLSVDNQRFVDVPELHDVALDRPVVCFDDSSGGVLATIIAPNLPTLIEVGPEPNNPDNCTIFDAPFWSGESSLPAKEPTVRRDCGNWSELNGDGGGVGGGMVGPGARWYGTTQQIPCQASLPLLCLCW